MEKPNVLLVWLNPHTLSGARTRKVGEVKDEGWEVLALQIR